MCRDGPLLVGTQGLTADGPTHRGQGLRRLALRLVRQQARQSHRCYLGDRVRAPLTPLQRPLACPRISRVRLVDARVGAHCRRDLRHLLRLPLRREVQQQLGPCCAAGGVGRGDAAVRAQSGHRASLSGGPELIIENLQESDETAVEWPVLKDS